MISLLFKRVLIESIDTVSVETSNYYVVYSLAINLFIMLQFRENIGIVAFIGKRKSWINLKEQV
jgi:spore coat protein CotH